MIIQPQSHLLFSGFGYAADPGERKNNQTGETEPIKILTFVDQPSGLKMSFVFSQPEWEKFMETVGERRIIAASQLPKA